MWSCARVPISGRRQISLLPESQMMSMSLTQYQSFLSENPPVADNMDQTKMVKRVGQRIALAVEKYMKDKVKQVYVKTEVCVADTTG